MSATTIRARWYSVDARGMATLCRDEADAIQTAADCSIQWPNLAPHRAVQLGDISALLAQHARDSAELRRLCQARDDETKARKAAQEQLYAERDRSTTEVQRLQRELGQEAARLNWIERQHLEELGMGLVIDAPNDGMYYVCGDSGTTHYGKTLREALDKAQAEVA